MSTHTAAAPRELLSELADQLARRNIVFAIADASPQLRRELDRYGVTRRIGSEQVFDSLESARAAFHAARGDETEGET